jgi:hypothetical protein
MAPKKEEALAFVTDSNPYGAFINVAIDQAKLDLVWLKGLF